MTNLYPVDNNDYVIDKMFGHTKTAHTYAT